MLKRQLIEITNYHQLSDRIASSGQPTSDQFQVIAAANYDTVINERFKLMKGQLSRI